MSEIKNDSVLVKEIRKSVGLHLSRFKLSDTSSDQACYYVSVEDECNSTHSKGVVTVEQVKSHIEKADEYIGQISAALKAADQRSADSSKV